MGAVQAGLQLVAGAGLVGKLDSHICASSRYPKMGRREGIRLWGNQRYPSMGRYGSKRCVGACQGGEFGG